MLVTVADAMAFYMAAEGDKVKTAERYRQCQKHVARLLGETNAGEVRQRHISSYKSTRRGEGAADKTIKLELTFLRTCLRYAWRNDDLKEPPKFTLSGLKCPPRKRVASEAEAGKLMSVADLSLARAVVVAWSTGMRAGGVREARWSWLNATNRTITIPADYAKNGEENTEPLGPALWEALQVEPRHPVFLFCRWRRGRNGKKPLEATPWTKSTLYKAWHRLREAAGISDLRFHDLRRSYSSHAQERGHSAAAVQAVGGWLDPMVMQKHYSHASDAAKRAVVELAGGKTVGSGAPPRTGDC